MLTALSAALIAQSLPAQEADRGECFLKNGDRWLFVGDSITNTDTYRQVILHLLQLYHPDADIMIGNSAVNGVTSDYQAKEEFVPTVVTIMLGMNDVIHQDWPFTPDLKPKCDAYRESIRRKIRQYKEAGAQVILMTPTYTDERFPQYFNLVATKRFLVAFGDVCRELAAEEDCFVIPVGEEMEAYQDSLGIDRQLRADGVHPYGLGQYQIARSLYSRMNLAGRLTGKRELHEPPASLDIEVDLASRFMNTTADGVALTLSAAAAKTVKATWSIGGAHGVEMLTLGPEPTTWKIPIPEEAMTLKPGYWRHLTVDFAEGSQARVCVIDLARTRVLHMTDGVVEGKITTDTQRPDGQTVCTWRIEELGPELWFSGEVFDSDIRWTTGWPFARDGVQLWLDLRPADRFASINPDRDVSQILLCARKEPFFSVTPVNWTRPRLAYGTLGGGAETPTGYKWHYGIVGNVTDRRKAIDLKKMDMFGFNLSVCDSDAEPARGTTFYPLQQVDSPDPTRCLNLLVIIDRKGTFPGAETTNLHLWQ